jgi:hypothetical protein
MVQEAGVRSEELQEFRSYRMNLPSRLVDDEVAYCWLLAPGS